jgi:hypothetical protein
MQNTPSMFFWSNGGIWLILTQWCCAAVPWHCDAAPRRGNHQPAEHGQTKGVHLRIFTWAKKRAFLSLFSLFLGHFRAGIFFGE